MWTLKQKGFDMDGGSDSAVIPLVSLKTQYYRNWRESDILPLWCLYLDPEEGLDSYTLAHCSS